MKTSSFVLFAAIAIYAGACRKSAGHPSMTHSANSPATIMVDSTVGSVSRLNSSDTFVVTLLNPVYDYQVPLIVDIAGTSICKEGTRQNDSIWYDTVNISNGEVQHLTVVAANGDSTQYSIAYPYVYRSLTMIDPQSASLVSSMFVNGDTIYAATEHGLFISRDGGVTSTVYTSANGLGDNTVLSVCVQGNTIYAGTVGGLSISTDGGVSFNNYTTTNGLGDNTVQGVYVQGSNVYAATSGGLSISVDGGSTYTNYGMAAGVGLPVHQVFAANGDIYAATSAGLAVSVNGGTSFTNYTTTYGLPNNEVSAIYTQGNTFYAGTISGLAIAPSNLQSYFQYIGPWDINFSNLEIYCVYASGNSIYAGTSAGLAISTDGGAHFPVTSEAFALAFGLVTAVFVQGSNIYVASGSAIGVVTAR